MLCDAVFQVEMAMSHVSGWLNDCISHVDTDNPFSLPEVRPWVTVPEFASVLATLLVVTSEALLAQQQCDQTMVTASATGGSSSSSTGSPGSCTVSAGRTDTTNSATSRTSTSKEKVVHRWVKGALKNLPECTKALLETLGMDSTAVAWAAAAQRQQATFAIHRNLVVAFSRLMRCFSPRGGITVVMSPACEQPRRQQLLLLIPATLLHWASNTRAITHEHEKQRVLIASFGGEFISYWLRSSKVLFADLASGAGLSLQACGPWLQPYFPAAWVQQVLPDVQKLLAELLQQPWGPPALNSANTTSSQRLAAQAPGQLVRLQCRIMQSAVCRDENGDIPSAGSNSDVCTFRPVHGTDEHELAGFHGMTVQTVASLEGFIRAAAQQLAAGSTLDAVATKALNAINTALVSDGYTRVGPLLCLASAAVPGGPEQGQLYSLLSSTQCELFGCCLGSH